MIDAGSAQDREDALSKKMPQAIELMVSLMPKTLGQPWDPWTGRFQEAFGQTCSEFFCDYEDEDWKEEDEYVEGYEDLDGAEVQKFVLALVERGFLPEDQGHSTGPHSDSGPRPTRPVKPVKPVRSAKSAKKAARSRSAKSRRTNRS